MADIVKIGGGGIDPPSDPPDFTTEDAITIIGVAQEVKEQMGEVSRENPVSIAESIHLLNQMATSFGTDLH